MTAEFEKGFTVREPSWHYGTDQGGDETVFAEYPGRAVAMKAAGHDFTVVENPVFLGERGPDAYGGRIVFGKAEGWKSLKAEGGFNDGALLNIVRDSYTVVQNATLWDIVDALVEQPEVKYETAGVLRGGAVLWVMARVREPYQVASDASWFEDFIAVSTSHDGSGAAKAQAVNTRIVCMNTFQAAASESGASRREFTFRHTKNVMARIEDAKAALKRVDASHASFVALAEELSALPAPSKVEDLFLRTFIPSPESHAVVSDRVIGNIEEARAKVRAILGGVTVEGSGIRENGWGLFQAGLEYLDHSRKARSKDSYFSRNVLRMDRQKEDLAALVREVASA